MWRTRRALVTGAGGFVGSHLAEELTRRGASVRAFLRYTSRAEPGLLVHVDPKVRSELEIVRGDLRDADAVREAARGCTHIFHLGALIGIPYSQAHPGDAVETNVRGTLNVLMAARELGIERLVHASTSEVYGSARSLPMDEDHPLSAHSPYAASKIGADQLVESFFRCFELPAVTLRPFNTYGPRQSARAVIPTIITQALASERVKLGALDPRRDFSFVQDVVEGFALAGMTGGLSGEAIHLGSGRDIRIGDLAEKIIGLVGSQAVVELDSQRLRPGGGEVMHLCADNSKAKRLLGWEPRVPLDEGLRRSIDWVSRHLDRYEVGRYAI